MADEAVKNQREYYAKTAHQYDELHVADDDEHGFALAFMLSAMEHLGIESVLDVGSGTGRALLKIRDRMPHVRILGVEPSEPLRAAGHAKGLTPAQLVDGDALRLAYDDASFDLVCEFGVLHHVAKPAVAVDEMLRVARRAVFISDANNFGQGGAVARTVKQLIDAAGLWPLANFIKTRGKGYSYSEGDGVAYSYSVFNNYEQIARRCESVHMLNTMNATPNLYRTAAHVALLGVLRRS